MDEWYKTLDPQAKSEQDIVLLYSLHIGVGEVQLLTTLEAFMIPAVCEDRSLWLALDGVKGSTIFRDACEAVLAASRHRSGIPGLDTSEENVSDYLLDWNVRVGQRLILNYVDRWISKNPNGSLREMVDYFEHDATHLVNRNNIGGFLEEMIVSDQVKRLPRDWMTPAELDGVLRLAKEYGVDVPGNSYC